MSRAPATTTRPLLATTRHCAFACILACSVAPTLLAQDADTPPAETPAAEAPATTPAPTAKVPAPFPVAPLANTGWVLEFTAKTPKAVAVKLANGQTKWYWYMPFHIQNREEEAHWLIPSIEVVTDTGRIHNCNNPVPQEVYDTIYKRCGNALTEPILKIAGSMKPGKDFDRDSVAIWPADNKDVDGFTIYVTGIYGQTQVVNDPATGKPWMIPAKDPITGKPELDVDGKPILQAAELKRTLQLTYACPGTGANLARKDVELKDSKDVMR